MKTIQFWWKIEISDFFWEIWLMLQTQGTNFRADTISKQRMTSVSKHWRFVTTASSSHKCSRREGSSQAKRRVESAHACWSESPKASEERSASCFFHQKIVPDGIFNERVIKGIRFGESTDSQSHQRRPADVNRTRARTVSLIA